MSKTGDARDKKRMENMGKLQNELVGTIDKAKLPLQDLHMVLTVLVRQTESIFISRLRPRKGGK